MLLYIDAVHHLSTRSLGRTYSYRTCSCLRKGSGLKSTDFVSSGRARQLYKVVSAVPCLHNLCAACWSESLKRSSECPLCRTEVQEVRRNHDLANLVEEYLKANPSKKRSAEEMAEMDAKSTITDATLRVAGKKRQRADYEDEDEDEDDDEDEGSEMSDDYGDGYSSDGGAGHYNSFGGMGVGAMAQMGAMGGPAGAMAQHLLGQMLGRATGAGAPGALPPHMTRCPNCPADAATAVAPAPADGFVCPAAATVAAPGVVDDPNHIRCTACRGLLPKRATPPIPSRCQFCARTLCDAYRRSALCMPDGTASTAHSGCPAGFSGGLRPLGEPHGPEVGPLPPGADLAAHLRVQLPRACFNHNLHERTILAEYLAGAGITFQSLLSDLAAKVRDGTFQIEVAPAPADGMAGSMATFPWAAAASGRAAPPPVVTGAGAGAAAAASQQQAGLSGAAAADAHSCLACWNRLLPPLIYQYRAALPRASLPASVTGRPDCWYGHSCRTQSNPTNPQHAERLNHICEPRPARGGGGRGGAGGGGRGGGGGGGRGGGGGGAATV